jgi:hypothetical protein
MNDLRVRGIIMTIPPADLSIFPAVYIRAAEYVQRLILSAADRASEQPGDEPASAWPNCRHRRAVA